MRVKIRNVNSLQEEQVVLECVTMTPEFEDIQNYCLSKGNYVIGYNEQGTQPVYFHDIYYVEAIGERVFAYTVDQVYEIKKRLYELETVLQPYKFIRCSKSFIICLWKVDAIRPALNGRYRAHMANGEDVIVSRKYAKLVKQTIMEDM